MSPDNRALEDLLYNSDLGDEAEGAELGGGPAGLEESAAAENVSMTEVEYCTVEILYYCTSTAPKTSINYKSIISKMYSKYQSIVLTVQLSVFCAIRCF